MGRVPAQNPRMPKPFSPACERNQNVILEVLRQAFADRSRVLEIGSGTGQHAVHFARAIPRLVWQTSDVPAHLGGIRQWLAEAALANTPEPLAFDIDGDPPVASFDAVFSANTLHIMGWAQVQRLFSMLPGLMSEGAVLVVYGPFNYGGRFTSESNAAFDASLRADQPQRGIRDFEAVDALAKTAGLQLVEDRAMPANNRCLVWRRAG
jgi:cyclopropane fatty-acyl-phospholipid synthase-like methyltransferase